MRRLLVDPERAIAQAARGRRRAASPSASSTSSAPTVAASASTSSRCADGGRLWTFRDATHFKLVEEEQRGFLATMSHELKTPLSGIAGAAELLIESAAAASASTSSPR